MGFNSPSWKKDNYSLDYEKKNFEKFTSNYY